MFVQAATSFRSNLAKLAVVTLVLVFLGIRFHRHLPIDRFVGSSSNSGVSSIGTKGNYSQSNTNTQDSNGKFDSLVWPQIRKKLCPRSVPDVSLGPVLFELGRIEFGLDANASTSGNPAAASHNRKKNAHFFYDGHFKFTIYLDGSDPTNTILYAPIWKCANNQIHAYLKLLFDRKRKGAIRNPLDDSIGEGNHENDVYKHIQPKDMKRDNDNSYYFTFNHTVRTKPCVFSVLRDPISHFLSGYNEVEVRLFEGFGDAPEDSQRNQLASYTTIPYNVSSQQREQRFETLVRNLLKEHPSFATFPYYKHFAAMSRILPTLSKFDLLGNFDAQNNRWFLPTLENLTETFPGFLAERCPRAALNYRQTQSNETLASNSNIHTSGFLPMKRMGQHKSSLDTYGTYAAAKNVWKKGGTVSRALCAIHAMDYACFGDILTIPTICKEVYANGSFATKILGA